MTGTLYKHGGGLLKQPGGGLSPIAECCCKGAKCNYCMDTVTVMQFGLYLTGFSEIWCEQDFGIFGGKAKTTYNLTGINGAYIFERRNAEDCVFELISTTAPDANESTLSDHSWGSFNFPDRQWDSPPNRGSRKWGGPGGGRTEFKGDFNDPSGATGLLGSFSPGRDNDQNKDFKAGSPVTFPCSLEWSGGFFPPPDEFFDAGLWLYIENFQQEFNCNSFVWESKSTWIEDAIDWTLTVIDFPGGPDSVARARSAPYTPCEAPVPGDDGRCDLAMCPSPRWHSAMTEKVVFRSLL